MFGGPFFETFPSLRMVRARPIPFLPELLRWAGIKLIRRALAKADRRDGCRGPWLGVLDRLGMGFDSRHRRVRRLACAREQRE